MIDFFANGFAAIPDAASSHWAFLAYLAMVVGGVVLLMRVRRNKQLLEHLEKLPESARLKALQMEMSSVEVGEGLTPEQWLRSRIHSYYFWGFAILCSVAVIIFSIASIAGQFEMAPHQKTSIFKSETPIDSKSSPPFYNHDIRILVIVDDSSATSVKRDKNVYTRVSDELSQVLSRWGYNLVLEPWVATEMNIDTLGPGRLSMGDLNGYIKGVSLAAKTKESLNLGAVVPYSIHATHRSLAGGRLYQVRVRIQNKVYDPVSGSFLAKATDPTVEFQMDGDCAENPECRDETLGDHVVPIANAMGEALRRHLAQLTQGSGIGQTNGDTYSNDQAATDNSPVRAYDFRFRNFETRELLQITNVMENELPGFVRASAPQGGSGDAHYGYTTKAPEGKLYNWVHQLLMNDLGLESNRDYILTRDGSNFVVEKTMWPQTSAPTPKVGRFQ